MSSAKAWLAGADQDAILVQLRAPGSDLIHGSLIDILRSERRERQVVEERQIPRGATRGVPRVPILGLGDQI
jgi:hypothetical protein